jgi:GntR family transcriptional regulator
MWDRRYAPGAMDVSWMREVGITLDPGADVPIGVQLDWGIRAAVAAGRLGPGERLPALRELAAALGVNHNTVRAAVAKLEADGLLETRHGTGTFVAAGAGAHARHAALVEQILAWTRDAGLEARDVAAAVYVAGHSGAAPRRAPDAEAEERRALRAELAVLDRIVGELEMALPAAPAREPGPASRGPRLLSAAELRDQRAALVRRIAAAQGALDAGDERPASASAAERTPIPKARRSRRPGIAPAS